MAETVRGNKASTLRSRIPRPQNNRPDLWAYTSPCPASFAPPPKSRVPVFRGNLPVAYPEQLKFVPLPNSRIPVWREDVQDRRTGSEASSDHRERSASCTSVPEMSSTRTSPTRKAVTGKPSQSGQNGLHGIQAEHKKLEHMQAVFMHKIRTLSEQGQKLPGVFKFVVMVFNDEPKLVLQEGASKNIPLVSRSEELQKRLTAELANKDLTISELKKKLLLSEELACEQALRLDEINSAQMEKEGTVKFLKSELSTAKSLYSQLCSRLEEADHNLDRATKQVNLYLEKTTSLDTELKALSEKHLGNLATLREQEEKLKAATAEAAFHTQAEAQLRKDLDRMSDQLDLNHQMLSARSDVITKLQQSERNFREKFEDMFHQVGEKNTLINQLTNELEAKDEQFRNVMVTLKEKQGAVRRQENIIKLLEEQGVRTSLMRTKQEERNAAMQLEIAQLKHNLTNQAHFMLVNDGSPFFGGMQAESAQTIQQQQPSQQGNPAAEQRQLQ